MNPFHLEWEQQDLDIFFTFYGKEQNFKLKMCSGAIEKQRSGVEHICSCQPVPRRAVSSLMGQDTLRKLLPATRGSHSVLQPPRLSLPHTPAHQDTPSVLLFSSEVAIFWLKRYKKLCTHLLCALWCAPLSGMRSHGHAQPREQGTQA